MIRNRSLRSRSLSFWVSFGRASIRGSVSADFPVLAVLALPG